MNRYAHITPDTGTHELPAIWRGKPQSDIPTQPIGWPWLKPTVTRYETGRARWRRRWARIKGSQFVADLNALASGERCRAARYALVITCAIFMGLLTQDRFITWHGIETIPTGAQQ